MQKSLLALSILGVISSSAVANTQQDEQQLETIEIQAQAETESVAVSTASTKFSHDVLEVPFSRGLVDEKTLKLQDIQRIDDAIDLVSGVYRQTDYGGGFWDNYSFRGFSTDPDMGATTIRNGLSVNRGINTPKDMVNVQSLDFLKGAGASIYGRGELGGLLNVTSKKAQWNEQNEINLRLNSLEKYRVSVEHTAPVNDKLAYRLAVSTEKNKSFRDFVESERLFFSPQLAWKISDVTTLELDNEFLYHAGVFDRGVSATRDGQIVMNKETFTGELQDGRNKLKDNYHQLRLNHQINPNWQINSALSYKRTALKGISTEPRSMQADNETLNRFRRERSNESKDVLFQADILGKVQSKVAQDILVSMEAGHLQYKQVLYRINPSATNPNNINIHRPVYGVYLPAMGLNANYLEEQKYLAVNLQDQLFWTDKFSTLLGGRFDYVQQRFDDYRRNINSEVSHQAFSPRVGLNYKFNDQISAYANYGRSFAMNSRLDRNGKNFAPEKGENYEIGAKYNFNQQGLVNIALFKANKRNVLTTDPVDNNYFATAGEVSSQGVELDLSYNANDKLSLSANYAYTDAKVERDPYLAKGSRLSNIAKHSGAISANYEFLQDAQRTAGIGGQWVYVGERSGHYEDIGFNLPAYNLVNLHAYYAPSQQLRYQLNVNNVLNKDYYSASYSNMWIQPGEPINASLGVQWKF